MRYKAAFGDRVNVCAALTFFFLFFFSGGGGGGERYAIQISFLTFIFFHHTPS